MPKTQSKGHISRKKGFTLAEILVALVLIGIVAVMVIPKILNSNTQKTRNAIAKEVFVTVGELFLNCQESGNCNTKAPDWAVCNVLTNGGNLSGVDLQFVEYLKSHLDMTSNPTSGPPFQLVTGAQVGTPVIPGIAGNNTSMRIPLTVPNNPSFDIYFVLNGTTNNVTRYTTKYGATGTAADKTFMDTDVLKI